MNLTMRVRNCAICLYLLVFLFSCIRKKQENHVATAKQDTIGALKVTILTDLPDSLQPKTVALDTLPKTKTVAVPTHNGNSYSFINDKGETVKINLEPPIHKDLPVLLDAKGKPVKDSAGNTFNMGSGGISNFTSFTTDNGLVLDGISERAV